MGKSFFVPFPHPPTPSPSSLPHEIDFGALPRLVTPLAADGHCADSLLSSLIVSKGLMSIGWTRMRGRLFRNAPSNRATSHFREEVYYIGQSAIPFSLPVYFPSFLPSARSAVVR